MSRYLNEVRLGEKKAYFRDIIFDVRQEFGIPTDRRPVPHVTLFGPYDTADGYEVKHRTQDVLSQYRTVSFRVKGFDTFPEAGVVYADVVPSAELRELRQQLVSALKPVAFDYRPWDADDEYEFHITIATGLGRDRSRVLEYVCANYEPYMELYAKRVAALDGRDLMWEWDVPRGVALSADQATSQESWEQTLAALEQESTESAMSPAALKRVFHAAIRWIR